MKYKNQVHNMDCIEFLKLLPDNSIHSCVTDPPYGLEFMGKEWDNLKNMQDWHYQWATLVFQKLRPGAHILSFSGTRTYHRLTCAIEDAGFEIRDQIHWLYGSGFPKGQDTSNAIMEMQFKEWLKNHPIADAELKKLPFPSDAHKQRKLELMIEAGIISRHIGHRQHTSQDIRGGEWGVSERAKQRKRRSIPIISPATDEAKQWQGWNTQLKPAHEPIVLARKPISEPSIVENVLKHGTGAMNIDATRVSVNPKVDDMDRDVSRKPRVSQTWEEGSGFKNEDNPRTGVLPSGRYPANLILSHHSDCQLVQEGETKTIKSVRERDTPRLGKYGIYGNEQSGWSTDYDHDSGTAEIWNCVEGCPVSIIGEPARFFYCPKPTDTERNQGLMGDRNVHITVKPLNLMRWLVRLVTPLGGIVLDPFLGSGTTAIAAENEGFEWVGCELNEEYCEITKARIKALGGRQSTIGEFMEGDP